MCNSGCLDYSELPRSPPRDVNGENFSKGLEKRKIFGNFLEEGVENFNDHGCPKIRFLVDPKRSEEILICSILPFRHKTTLHCTERKAKFFWSLREAANKVGVFFVLCNVLSVST